MTHVVPTAATWRCECPSGTWSCHTIGGSLGVVPCPGTERADGGTVDGG
ncbi:MAG: hypothetical protein KF819_20045 [Labilithrix sp.]|nr:hypothetical protein [Labilithrix sp.]